MTPLASDQLNTDLILEDHESTSNNAAVKASTSNQIVIKDLNKLTTGSLNQVEDYYTNMQNVPGAQQDPKEPSTKQGSELDFYKVRTMATPDQALLQVDV